MDSKVKAIKGQHSGRRFILCGDSHGKEADLKSLESVLDFAKDFKPEVVVHLGDCWDFASIRKKASPEEQAESLIEDWEMGKDFFLKYFSFGKERHFLRGNHDERIYYHLTSVNGVVRDYASNLCSRVDQLAQTAKVHMLPYDSRHGVLSLGMLQIVHGFHVGVGACAAHARIYDNCVFGHIHSIESYQVPGLRQREARSIGCLCKQDIEYMQTKTAKLRWANGWAYGLLHADGTYNINQTRKVEGNFYAAKEFDIY